MKEIKAEKQVNLKKYGVKVNRYLTLDQIQIIANAVKEEDAWNICQKSVDKMVLAFTTDIGAERIDKIVENDPDILWTSGLVDAVKKIVVNYNRIEEARSYTGALRKAITELINKAPTRVVKNNGVSDKK